MIGVVENKISIVAERLRKIAIEISKSEGSFVLFVLIEREDSFGKWDLVISADWIGNNQKRIINMIAHEISTKLEKDEQLLLSRILVLPPSDRFVQNLNRIRFENQNVRLTNVTFNGILVKEVIFITSNPQKKEF